MALFPRLMPGQQDLLKWRGVESVFEFAGIVPRIDRLYFFRPGAGGSMNFSSPSSVRAPSSPEEYNDSKEDQPETRPAAAFHARTHR